MSALNRIRQSSHAEDLQVIHSRRLAAALMAAYLAVVALIVFWPTADIASGSVSGVWSVLHAAGAPSWITPGGVEFVTNAVMFMPLSFLGNTFRPRWGWRQWLYAGLACTVTIELTQLLFLPGRSAQVRDVVSNTLGALAGYLVVTLVRRVRSKTSIPG